MAATLLDIINDIENTQQLVENSNYTFRKYLEDTKKKPLTDEAEEDKKFQTAIVASIQNLDLGGKLKGIIDSITAGTGIDTMWEKLKEAFSTLVAIPALLTVMDWWSNGGGETTLSTIRSVIDWTLETADSIATFWESLKESPIGQAVSSLVENLGLFNTLLLGLGAYLAVDGLISALIDGITDRFRARTGPPRPRRPNMRTAAEVAAERAAKTAAAQTASDIAAAQARREALDRMAAAEATQAASEAAARQAAQAASRRAFQETVRRAEAEALQRATAAGGQAVTSIADAKRAPSIQIDIGEYKWNEAAGRWQGTGTNAGRGFVSAAAVEASIARGGAVALGEITTEAVDDQVARETTRLLGLIDRQLADVVADQVGKFAWKAVPVIGAGTGLWFSVTDALAGDYTSAGMGLSATALDLAPGLGSAASIAVDLATIPTSVFFAITGESFDPNNPAHAEAIIPINVEVAKAVAEAMKAEETPEARRARRLDEEAEWQRLSMGEFGGMEYDAMGNSTPSSINPETVQTNTQGYRAAAISRAQIAEQNAARTRELDNPEFTELYQMEELANNVEALAYSNQTGVIVRQDNTTVAVGASDRSGPISPDNEDASWWQFWK